MDPRALDDDELVARFQEKDDQEAFDELVRRYEDRIFRLVYRKIGRYEEARDVTQEVFIRAYKGLKKFRGQSKFYTWLFRIGINTSLTARGKLARRNEHKAFSMQAVGDTDDGGQMQAPDTSTEPVRHLMRREQDRQVQEAISELPPIHRDVILLKDIEGLKYKEIGEVLDLPVGSVKSRLYRARKALKEKLERVLEV